MTITMSEEQLTNAMARAAEYAVSRTIERLCKAPIIISYKEVKALYGKKLADEARLALSIDWVPYTGKDRDGCYCKREALDLWFSSRKQSFYK